MGLEVSKLPSREITGAVDLAKYLGGEDGRGGFKGMLYKNESTAHLASLIHTQVKSEPITVVLPFEEPEGKDMRGKGQFSNTATEIRQLRRPGTILQIDRGSNRVTRVVVSESNGKLVTNSESLDEAGGNEALVAVLTKIKEHALQIIEANNNRLTGLPEI